MKLRPGPKYIAVALIFLAFGLWAGRGGPITWNGFLHPAAVPGQASEKATAVQPPPVPQPASPESDQRLSDLERRVDVLQRDVATLRDDVQNARPARTEAAPDQGSGQATDVTPVTPVAPRDTGTSPFPATTGP